MDVIKINKAACFISLALGIWLAAETPHIPPKPLQINGTVYLAIRPYDTFLRIATYVRRGVILAKRVRVTLMGQAAVKDRSGQHVCIIAGVKPVAGSRANVTFSSVPASKEGSLTAEAPIDSLIAIVSPTSGTRLPLRTTSWLNVAWSGGHPPYTVYVFPFVGLQILGDEIFKREVFTGTNALIPVSIFKPGKKYGIYLSASMGKFVFDGAVDAESRVDFQQSVGTYVYPE